MPPHGWRTENGKRSVQARSAKPSTATERATNARRAEWRERVEGLPCGADTKDQGAAFAAPENREQRTENRTRDKRAEGSQRLPEWGVQVRSIKPSTATADVSSLRSKDLAVVHRLKPIRGRLPPAGRDWKLGSLEGWRLGGAPEVEARAVAFGDGVAGTQRLPEWEPQRREVRREPLRAPSVGLRLRR